MNKIDRINTKCARCAYEMANNSTSNSNHGCENQANTLTYRSTKYRTLSLSLFLQNINTLFKFVVFLFQYPKCHTPPYHRFPCCINITYYQSSMLSFFPFYCTLIPTALTMRAWVNRYLLFYFQWVLAKHPSLLVVNKYIVPFFLNLLYASNRCIVTGCASEKFNISPQQSSKRIL